MGDGLSDLVQKDMSYCGHRPSYCERTRQRKRPNAAPSGNQYFKVLCLNRFVQANSCHRWPEKRHSGGLRGDACIHYFFGHPARNMKSKRTVSAAPDGGA